MPMIAGNCCAKVDGDKACRCKASILDPVRGGLVCPAHRPLPLPALPAPEESPAVENPVERGGSREKP